jgi:hypothetical protein
VPQAKQKSRVENFFGGLMYLLTHFIP